MDLSTKTRKELIDLCKERGISGYSSKTKPELLELLKEPSTEKKEIQFQQQIIQGDTLKVLPTLASESAQIVIADPPYNIGKDFGNASDRQPMQEFSRLGRPTLLREG